MIRSMEHMKKFEIVATDGRIGAVDDFYFDDERWAIRYVVVDTGRWLPGRRVLISRLRTGVIPPSFETPTPSSKAMFLPGS